MPAASNLESLCERSFEEGSEPFRDSLTWPVLHRDDDLDAMKFQVAERVPDDKASGACRVAAAGVVLADPVAQFNASIGHVSPWESAGTHHSPFRITDQERMPTCSPSFVYPLLGAVD